MLVLSRRIGEEVVIGRDVRLTILAVHGGTVRVGITAPPTVPVDRKEVRERRVELLGRSGAAQS
ncbi:MAG TPA: carbon storage regulator [Gemmataceae bacterium]|jgi:carbon storage regulator|nr:carbon storage regulator [Gemmataceae bacterium]